ncbi:hypothetical protein [Microbacterium sp. NPDC055455]
MSEPLEPIHFDPPLTADEVEAFIEAMQSQGRLEPPAADGSE